MPAKWTVLADNVHPDVQVWCPPPPRFDFHRHSTRGRDHSRYPLLLVGMDELPSTAKATLGSGGRNSHSEILTELEGPMLLFVAGSEVELLFIYFVFCLVPLFGFCCIWLKWKVWELKLWKWISYLFPIYFFFLIHTLLESVSLVLVVRSRHELNGGLGSAWASLKNPEWFYGGVSVTLAPAVHQAAIC